MDHVWEGGGPHGHRTFILPVCGRAEESGASWSRLGGGRRLTLEADGVVARVRVRVTGLVGVEVHRSHAQQPSSTLGPGDVDGVAHAPVLQPAGVAHVHAGLPRQVQLSGGGQPSAQLGALILGFVEGELVDGGGVEDSAWEDGAAMLSWRRPRLLLTAYLPSSQRSSRRRRSRWRPSRRRSSRRGSSPCLRSKAAEAPGWDTWKRDAGQRVWTSVCHLLDGPGQQLWTSLSPSVVPAPPGQPRSTISVHQDVDALSVTSSVEVLLHGGQVVAHLTV